jgi:hypothetical protein
MRRVPRGPVALVAVLTATVFAGAVGASEEGKIALCHGTASEPKPYVLIEVDASALAGHFDGTDPGHGPRNHPDVYPVDGACPEVPPDGEF